MDRIAVHTGVALLAIEVHSLSGAYRLLDNSSQEPMDATLCGILILAHGGDVASYIETKCHLDVLSKI